MVRVLLVLYLVSFGILHISQWVVTKNIAPGTVYEGFWRSGRYHGTGIISNPNTGLLHRGEFQNGKRHGDAISFKPDGSFTNGTWIDDALPADETVPTTKLKRYFVLLSYFKLQIKVLLRKRAETKDAVQEKEAVRIAKIYAKNKDLHHSKHQDDDIPAIDSDTLKLSKPQSEYDNFCDRLAKIGWNRDVCRKDTNAARGKGTYVMCSCVLCLLRSCVKHLFQ